MAFQSISKRFPRIPVKLSKETITVPDMSFTPREIIAKFSRGEKVPLGFEGLYDDETVSPFDDDPTRDPSFDFGDYVEEKHALEERNKAKQTSKKNVNSNLKHKASSEELSASDATTSETTSES